MSRLGIMEWRYHPLSLYLVSLLPPKAEQTYERLCFEDLYSSLDRPERVGAPLGLNPHGFSVLRRSYRHASPQPSPKPLSVLGGVVVSIEACSASGQRRQRITLLGLGSASRW